jgi:UDP-GlcNAc:undecaprenyl-phosphate GlcNAc-1-phosphate transferase
MLWLIAGCLVSSFLTSLLVTALMRRIAPRCGLIDLPSERKVHQTPTPLGGGLGILAGVMLPLVILEVAVHWVGSLAERPEWLPLELYNHAAGARSRTGQLLSIVGAGLIISGLGLLDDLKNLSWKPRLLVQFLVAGGLVFGGVRATLFTQAPWVGHVVTILWIVGLTNSFNFLDNMDGLSAGVAAISSAIFALIMLAGTSEPHLFVAGFLLLLLGSLGGFLVHNWPPARIFMGDSGSCLIGLWIACLTVVGTFYDYKHAGQHVVLAPLCVLAVPLYDFASVMLIRLLKGRSPFRADKSHFSHRLVDMGLSRAHAVLTIHLITLTTGLGGMLLYLIENWGGALAVFSLVGCMLAVIAILESAGRREHDA